MRTPSLFAVAALSLTGCLVSTQPRYVYVPQQGATVVASAGPNYNFDHTRRADLDGSCRAIGAGYFGYRVLGGYSHQAAANVGCRPGLNMFGNPDPDVYCCSQMLPATGVAYAQPVVAAPTFQRMRRGDLDGNCRAIGAPPYGWRVSGYYNQQGAQQSGCRMGLNMFGRPDPEIYCCGF